MSYKLAYSGLFWRAPDLAQELEALRTFGWDGWEARQPLDWLGTPQRVRRLCETSGVEVAAVCGPNIALDLDGPSQQINKRRIEFAAELGVETFMTKGPGREGRNGTDAELDQMAAAYEDLAAYGANLGVVVTFHPHINHLVDSADEWKRFMGRLDACRLCMDMSHAVHWGCDPVQAVRDFRRADRVRASARFQGWTDRGTRRRPHVRLPSIYGGIAGSRIHRLDHGLPRRSPAARNREDANQPPVPAQHWLLESQRRRKA